MSSNKIVRSVCFFTDKPSLNDAKKLSEVAEKLESSGYLIQTKRMCAADRSINDLKAVAEGVAQYTSLGGINYQEALRILPGFIATENLAMNIDLSEEEIDYKYAEFLFKVINENPAKTFDFTFTFNNSVSSPYFPSATYGGNGFSVGLQPTNLAASCNTLEEWLQAMQSCWKEIHHLFSDDPDFLGIDSSIAPIGGGDGSFVSFLKRLGLSFEKSATTSIYTDITGFIKSNNPKPVGLCGMMLPCLEDDDLAAEYENGMFSIERNIFLSLHSGLGIDTYPIGVDESLDRTTEILKLLQALSKKYQKPLSARFVSDGKARIGERTDFQNQYLADCTVRSL